MCPIAALRYLWDSAASTTSHFIIQHLFERPYVAATVRRYNSTVSPQSARAYSLASGSSRYLGVAGRPGRVTGIVFKIWRGLHRVLRHVQAEHGHVFPHSAPEENAVLVIWFTKPIGAVQMHFSSRPEAIN
jgi:hypothetical protein